MKLENEHNAYEKLHEENVGFEALVERCDSAVLRRQRVWRQLCNATYPFVRSVLHLCKGTYPFVGNALQAVQRHLSICQKRIARCAKVPIQLSEAHCKVCKGTYPIVGSTLQGVQRYLSNCRKHIVNCKHRSHYAVNQ